MYIIHISITFKLNVMFRGILEILMHCWITKIEANIATWNKIIDYTKLKQEYRNLLEEIKYTPIALIVN